MYHFFVGPEDIGAGKIRITGGDVNHIRNVLRMKPGEEISVADAQGTVYRCRILSLEKEAILAAIESQGSGEAELPSEIYLFQGLPKSDKMDWIVQKAVELGVTEVIPVTTRRTVVRLDKKKEAAKVQRWQSIAEGAAKQSGRARIPRVHVPLSFAEALEYAQRLPVKLLPYELAEGMESTRDILSGIRPGQAVGVFIGPEGGFEETEVRQAEAAGFKQISLGRRILRTETAGLAVLAVLGYLLEE